MSFTANIDDVVAENRNHLLGKHPKWERVRLKEVATILNGYPFESGRFKRSGGTPLIRIRDILDGRTETFYDGEFDSTFLVKRGEILIGMDGDFHCEPWAGEPALLNQRVCKITPDESRYAKQFLRYLLPGYLSAINAQTPSVTVKHLSSRTIADIPLPLPAMPEQRRIVAEIEKQFTRLEAGVAALRRVQSNLKRYRAAVLKAACEGRLVPTEAELQKSERRGQKSKAKFETGAELLARILTERRKIHERAQADAARKKKYKEPTPPSIPADEQLPEGWTWATWDQTGFSQNGRPFPSAEYQETGFKLLRPGNLHVSGKVVWTDSNTRCMPQRFADENPDLIVRGGELVMNLTAQSLKDEFLGRVCITNDDEGCLLNQRLARLTPILVSPKFVLYLLKAWQFRRYVDGLNSGSLIQHMFTSQLAEFTFPLPPLAEQTRIVAEVERRLSVVEELESVVTANLQRATRLRQSILQRAFTGKLVAQESEAQPANIIELPKAEVRQRPNRHFARALLSAEIVHRLHNEPTFGRIKHQKIFHLCEHIAQIEEIEGQYHREVAGPLDNKLIYANEAELKKQKWYQEVHRTSFGHAYEPLAKAGVHRKYVEGYWPDKLPVIEKLIELMRKWDTDTCEIFCTAYAAWNDLLLWGKEPSEAAILNEVLNRWHESKRRFPEDRWHKAIGWMKKEGFVPIGFGKQTAHAT